ncbi:YetF domain-containing protein [Bacillus sp. JCM 19034]|uniref:YetF domain-containing protein n=1 Tax=Bacillus sp. JCM 19034 TaxID=1481928 RepID=UPI0007808D1D|nr:YetF domain-containing protein [Bacillus sp. JCM 19034]
MEYVTIIVRAVFIYFIVLFAIRLCKKREWLNIVVVFMIAQLGVVFLIYVEKPLLLFLLPTLTLLLIHILYIWLIKKEEEMIERIQKSHSQQEVFQKIIEKERTSSSERATLPAVLIIDGKIQFQTLQVLKKTEFWLRKQLKQLGYRNIKAISYCSFKDGGTFYIEETSQDYS